MPKRIKTFCRYPGCRQVGHGRFCEQHQRLYHRTASANRTSSTQRGYDARWRRLRRWYLARHPLCEDCLDEGVDNYEHLDVDHIVPISVRPDLRLVSSNLRTRCRMHHRRKTLRDERKYRAGKSNRR